MESNLPFSNNDSLFTARIDVASIGKDGSSNIPATGTDTLKIVVRDMFDYD